MSALPSYQSLFNEVDRRMREWRHARGLPLSSDPSTFSQDDFDEYKDRVGREAHSLLEPYSTVQLLEILLADPALLHYLVVCHTQVDLATAIRYAMIEGLTGLYTVS